MNLQFRHIVIFWAAMSAFQIVWGLYWGVAPQRYLFTPVVVGLFLLVIRWPPTSRLIARLPGQWWLKAMVTFALMMGLYEWVKTL